MVSVFTAAEVAGEFELAGRIIAYIIEHGGPAPQFMSETAFSCLTGKPDVDETGPPALVRGPLFVLRLEPQLSCEDLCLS